MKFAHMADCHIGSWRDPKLRDASTKAFIKAMDISMQEQVDFILISGDLFNTSLPSIEFLKDAVMKLKEVSDKGFPIYIIPGSHDFSPSGKTMLDVLENAGLFTNVVCGEVVDNKLKLHFTVDPKTGAKITGILGKKGQLDRKYYESLITENLESEPGYKIFMFHTALTELKPKELEQMESAPISLLPKNFDYYAGGHVHIVKETTLPGYQNVVYPGPLFPNSFSELEKLKHGSFYIVEENKPRFIPIELYKTEHIILDCHHKSPEEIEAMLLETTKRDVQDKIVTLRLSGTLTSGRISDIDFRKVFEAFYEQGAYFVMKHAAALKTKDFEEVKINITNTEDIEDALIREHLPQDQVALAKSLMQMLAKEKEEGERVIDFEDRLRSELKEHDTLKDLF